MEKSKISKILKLIVNNLTSGKYASLVENDKYKRLTINEIETAIKEYPGIISFPPLEAFDNFLDLGEIDDIYNNIDFNLWFNDEESDLTISLTIYDTGEYSINKIHVL